VDFDASALGGGDFIEVQAGGEEAVFNQAQLHRLLEMGKQGIALITAAQRQALGKNWPLD
jgi:ribonuclease PH